MSMLSSALWLVSCVAELEFDFDADGWWYGSNFFDSGKEIS